MKKVTFTVIFLFTALALFSMFMWQGKFALRRSPAAIRESFLSETPLGMSFDEVIKILTAKGLTADIYKNQGFLKQEGATAASYHVVGKKSIRVRWGHYVSLSGPHIINSISVTVFWGFDEEGKLIDVWVWKVTDGY